MTNLPRYSGAEPECPKCGYQGASTHWRALDVTTYDDAEPVTLDEHLLRQCRCCFYRWHEACLDSEDTQ